MNPRFTESIATPGDAEMAELVYDSQTDPQAASAVRGTPEWRQLSFRASGLTMELSITATGTTRRLIGQLLPRQPASIEIRNDDSTIAVRADDLGRFTADDVPAGPVSIRCRLGTEDDHRPIVTGWITI